MARRKIPGLAPAVVQLVEECGHHMRQGETSGGVVMDKDKFDLHRAAFRLIVQMYAGEEELSMQVQEIAKDHSTGARIIPLTGIAANEIKGGEPDWPCPSTSVLLARRREKATTRYPEGYWWEVTHGVYLELTFTTHVGQRAVFSELYDHQQTATDWAVPVIVITTPDQRGWRDERIKNALANEKVHDDNRLICYTDTHKKPLYEMPVAICVNDALFDYIRF
jgi:hypothetical protein